MVSASVRRWMALLAAIGFRLSTESLPAAERHSFGGSIGPLVWLCSGAVQEYGGPSRRPMEGHCAFS